MDAFCLCAQCPDLDTGIRTHTHYRPRIQETHALYTIRMCSLNNLELHGFFDTPNIDITVQTTTDGILTVSGPGKALDTGCMETPFCNLQCPLFLVIGVDVYKDFAVCIGNCEFGTVGGIGDGSNGTTIAVQCLFERQLMIRETVDIDFLVL